MRDIIQMIVVLAVLGAASGGGLALVKSGTAEKIEYQQLKFVKGPAILAIMEGCSNDPIVDRFKIPYGESDASHVDYGSGMSEWCANCHNGILNSEHKSGSGLFEHPAGNNAYLDSAVSRYNSYIKTGDFSGVQATAYLALVPFERGVYDPAQLNPTSTEGPDNTSRIMCLTCHRAHASAFQYAGRWDFGAELVADSHPAAGDGGVSGTDPYYSYYGRDMVSEFGASQRNLCEKCHDVPRDGYPPGW